MEETQAPLSLDDVVAGLKGFGIEDFEEILTITAGSRKVDLRLSNIPTEDEMQSLLAVEEHKGYEWVQRVKCEILSRAISYLNGVSIRSLSSSQRLVIDPTDGLQTQKDIQVVLRNLLLSWGQEVVGILWKVLMTHANRIEERLYEQFPDSAVMTEYEKRFMEQAYRDIEAQNAAVIEDTMAKMYEPSVDGPLPDIDKK